MSELYQDSTSFPLTFLAPPTTLVTRTDSTPSEANIPVHIYAIIGLLASVIFILILCGVVVMALACMLQGKAEFNKKSCTLRNSCQDIKVNEKLNSLQHAKPCGNVYQSSTPANSTIGFPTQEHRLKRTVKVKDGRIQGRRKPIPSPRRDTKLQRSQSLPSLLSPHGLGESQPSFFSQVDPAALPRRINPHRVRVTKKPSIESSKLNLWNRQQLKRNKELANLHIVQDLAIRFKSYGVNEIQSGPVAVGRHGRYAKYMVRTLAASAKTPEPGAWPMTKL